MSGRILVLVILLAATGCVDPLTYCAVEGTRDIIFYGDGECPAACFVDEDGDGYGGAFHRLDVGQACEGEGLTPREGDCDDGDDNLFPTNPEVCDGRDNDCIGGADFDAEGEEIQGEEGSMVFSCTPPRFTSEFDEEDSLHEVRFFLRGGGVLNDQTIDARHFEASVGAGAPIYGTIKIRAVVSSPDASTFPNQIDGAIAASWVANRPEGFRPLPNFGPNLSGVEIAPNYWDFDILIGERDDLLAPEIGANETNHHLLTLAASNHLGDTEHVAALTDAKYCCEDREDEACVCPAVWSAEVEEDDLLLPLTDLADLDPLDLAGCRSYGAARMPTLRMALSVPEQEGCRIVEEDDLEEDDLEEDDCVPIVDAFEIGCSFLSLVVEEGDEG